MIVEQSLLELMAAQMGCTYLSDLRFLLPEQYRILARELDRLAPMEEDVQDWNDALQYLTGVPPEETARAAKERLIDLLLQMEWPMRKNCLEPTYDSEYEEGFLEERNNPKQGKGDNKGELQ